MMLRRLLVVLPTTFVLIAFASLGDLAHGSSGVPILLYHQFSTSKNPLPLSDETMDLDLFVREMRYLHDAGYRAIGTDELVRAMQHASPLPTKAVVIQFDDGRKSVLDALPELERYDFKATFFIIVDDVGWEQYLDWADIAKMANNPRYEFYSHTMSHGWHGESDLLSWSEGRTPGKGMADADWELRESKRILEAGLGRQVPYLAWPFGAYNARLIKAAQEAGYSALFTVEWGRNERGGDVLRMRRSYASGLCGIHVFQQVLENGQSRTCPSTASNRASSGVTTDAR